MLVQQTAPDCAPESPDYEVNRVNNAEEERRDNAELLHEREVLRTPGGD